MCNNNHKCEQGITTVQSTLLTVLFEKQLTASQNTLESAKLWQKTAKFFFFGMCFAFLLSIMLAVGYFYFYDFEMEITEEEETYSIEQDTTSNGSNNASQIIMGDVTHGETEDH